MIFLILIAILIGDWLLYLNLKQEAKEVIVSKVNEIKRQISNKEMIMEWKAPETEEEKISREIQEKADNAYKYGI